MILLLMIIQSAKFQLKILILYLGSETSREIIVSDLKILKDMLNSILSPFRESEKVKQINKVTTTISFFTLKVRDADAGIEENSYLKKVLIG
jgi:hypothetical protein